MLKGIIKSFLGLDMIQACSILNSYAPNKPEGGKMKVCLHGDQGDGGLITLRLSLFTFSFCRTCVSLLVDNL